MTLEPDLEWESQSICDDRGGMADADMFYVQMPVAANTTAGASDAMTCCPNSARPSDGSG